MKNTDLSGKTQAELVELLHSYKNILETEERYHAILDNMKEGFQIINYEYRYDYVNNSVVQQSNYTKEDLLGNKMTEKYPGIEKTELFSVLQQCMTLRIARSIENEFTYPNGSKRWFSLSIQPIPEGIFILSMDITDRKQTEQDREKHIHEIRQLLFKISHEVRQPVCHILGVAELLDKSLVTPEDLHSVIKSMRNAVELLDVYTRDLTTFVYEMRMNTHEK